MDAAVPVPRAAYVHVPFCRHRCGYCNFTLIAGRDDLIERYLQALEIELRALEVPRSVDTLFIGGGTPTHLSSGQLRQLFALLHHWFPLASGYELSVEANPADCTAERMELLGEQGVTRISLGGQSFQADKLRLLERDHSAGQIEQAVAVARRYVKSVSLDLIFGTPGESLAQWHHDLGSAIRLAPDHMSTYGLTFERGTSFWSRLQKSQLREIDDELWRAMYEAAIDGLTAEGFEHYEVSNFARRGHRCRHNEVYWSGAEYYAVGPGAARYVGGRRETNHHSTTTWMQKLERGLSPVADAEELSAEDRARELLVLGLRRLEGVDPHRFFGETGYELAQLAGEALQRHLEMQTLEYQSGRLRLTRQGLFVSDAIWPDFLRT